MSQTTHQKKLQSIFIYAGFQNSSDLPHLFPRKLSRRCSDRQAKEEAQQETAAQHTSGKGNTLVWQGRGGGEAHQADELSDRQLVRVTARGNLCDQAKPKPLLMEVS